MFRKLLILLTLTIPEKRVLLVTIVVVASLCLILQIAMHPFDNRSFFVLHRLEYLNVGCLIVAGCAQSIISFCVVRGRTA